MCTLRLQEILLFLLFLHLCKKWMAKTFDPLIAIMPRI